MKVFDYDEKDPPTKTCSTSKGIKISYSDPVSDRCTYVADITEVDPSEEKTPYAVQEFTDTVAAVLKLTSEEAEELRKKINKERQGTHVMMLTRQIKEANEKLKKAQEELEEARRGTR